MLDTPVSGSVPQVKTGTLTIMVGGDEDAYARIEPVLRMLGTPEYVGENGQGLVLKLAINISLAVQSSRSQRACCSRNARASTPTSPPR